MVKWYFGLKGRSWMGSVVSWLKLGRGVIGGKMYFFCELVVALYIEEDVLVETVFRITRR